MKRRYVLLAVVTGILCGMAPFHQVASAQETPQRIEITAKQFTFDPPEITLKKGQPVVLVLKSADVAHGLGVRELKLDIKVSNHGTSQIQFTPDKAGDFVGQCSVFCGSGHKSMMMKIHIVE